MPSVRKLFLIAATLVLCAASAAASPTTSASRNQPFTTFRQLDARLSRLDKEYADLKRTLETKATTPHQRRVARYAWKRAAKRMHRDVTSIRKLALRMESRYRTRGEKFGARLFAVLSARATTMAKELRKLEQTNVSSIAQRSSDAAGRSMLNLVLAFQAASGDYGAAHCEPKQWACGEPKPQPDTPGYPRLATKWVCVSRASQCSGLLGPRTPALEKARGTRSARGDSQ